VDQAVFDWTGLYNQYNQAPSGGKNYLFACKGGRNGVIDLFRECKTGCHDSGSDASDYCEGESVDGEVEATVPEIQVQVNVGHVGL